MPVYLCEDDEQFLISGRGELRHDLEVFQDEIMEVQWTFAMDMPALDDKTALEILTWLEENCEGPYYLQVNTIEENQQVLESDVVSSVMQAAFEQGADAVLEDAYTTVDMPGMKIFMPVKADQDKFSDYCRDRHGLTFWG